VLDGVAQPLDRHRAPGFDAIDDGGRHEVRVTMGL
jgi:hypothetical protein